MGSRRIARVGPAIALLALGIAGCTPVDGAHSHMLASNATSPHATDAPVAQPSASTPPAPALDGVIASGILASADGRTKGQVVLTATGNTVTATVENFVTAATGQLDLHLTPHPESAKCPADNWSFVMNGVDGKTDTWSLPISVHGGPFEIDPTFLHTVVLRVDADGGTPNADGCVYPVLAVAPLTWSTTPHARVVVTDHGARPHASGSVTTENGKPSMYTVAPNDTIETIRARFGVTADDFSYLNPFTGMIDNSELRYGSVYNLSPALRGAPSD
jgi:hypothetical protein